VKKRVSTAAVVLVFIGALSVPMLFYSADLGRHAVAQEESSEPAIIKLPPPELDGPVSVEKALSKRRSVRAYKDEPLTLAEVSQILWAAQGVSDSASGKRTAPSARAQYFLDVYLICGNVKDLSSGMYRYHPEGHRLERTMEGDAKAKLFDAAGQAPIKAAPAALVIAGDSERSTNPNWFYLEAGHAAQNVYLQAVPLNLGTVVMAGFKPEEVKKALNIPKGEEIVYIMPLGRK
jgi:SagB-type dehydrogenase family enzyme